MMAAVQVVSYASLRETVQACLFVYCVHYMRLDVGALVLGNLLLLLVQVTASHWRRSMRQ